MGITKVATPLASRTDMATIDDNVGRSHRLQPNLPPKGGAGKPPQDPPKEPKLETKSDERKITARPQSEQERQTAALAAVKAAQAGPGTSSTKKKDEEDGPPAKTVADAIGVADGVREGVRIGSNMDELRNLPILGKMVQGESHIGRLLTSLARSNMGQTLSNVLQNHKYIAPVARGLGRIAPFAGAAIAGFDIYSAVKTVNDPKATKGEKGLAITKSVFSSISGVAGLAALALAPTGVGAVIAGGIALGAGLISTGLDLWLGHVKRQRKKEEEKQPAAAK